MIVKWQIQTVNSSCHIARLTLVIMFVSVAAQAHFAVLLNWMMPHLFIHMYLTLLLCQILLNLLWFFMTECQYHALWDRMESSISTESSHCMYYYFLRNFHIKQYIRQTIKGHKVPLIQGDAVGAHQESLWWKTSEKYDARVFKQFASDFSRPPFIVKAWPSVPLQNIITSVMLLV